MNIALCFLAFHSLAAFSPHAIFMDRDGGDLERERERDACKLSTPYYSFHHAPSQQSVLFSCKRRNCARNAAKKNLLGVASSQQIELRLRKLLYKLCFRLSYMCLLQKLSTNSNTKLEQMIKYNIKNKIPELIVHNFYNKK